MPGLPPTPGVMGCPQCQNCAHLWARCRTGSAAVGSESTRNCRVKRAASGRQMRARRETSKSRSAAAGRAQGPCGERGASLCPYIDKSRPVCANDGCGAVARCRWGTERSDIFHVTCCNRLAGGGRGGGPGGLCAPQGPAAVWAMLALPSHLHHRHPGTVAVSLRARAGVRHQARSAGMEASEPSAQLGSFSCSTQTFRAVLVAEKESTGGGWIRGTQGQVLRGLGLAGGLRPTPGPHLGCNQTHRTPLLRAHVAAHRGEQQDQLQGQGTGSPGALEWDRRRQAATSPCDSGSAAPLG